MRSLQARLGLGLAASLALLVVAQWVLVTYAVRHLAENYVISRLEHDAEALLGALAFDPTGAPVLDGARVGPVYQTPFSGHYYRVATGVHELRSRSLWDEDLAGGAAERQRTEGPQAQPLLALTGSYEKQGHAVEITVAEDLTAIEQGLAGFRALYTVASLLALLLLLGGQFLAVRRGLAPLEAVRRELWRMERGEAARLDMPVPSEIAPLVREINRLTESLARRLERSRHALGNLAHALKGPLTLLTGLADAPALRAQPELRAQLLEQTAQLGARIERELKRARLAGGAAAGRFVPAQEIPPLIEALRAMYRDKALEITCEIPPDVAYAGDRQDLLELIGNLLENACKWARSRVMLTAEARDGLRILVEDDGPGCPPAQLPELAARGTRLDESTPGHGLGLAIARDIVDGYGGNLHLGRSERLGGFAACAWLPGAGPSTPTLMNHTDAGSSSAFCTAAGVRSRRADRGKGRT
jgi:signal transduction histidine kinase